MNSILEQEVKCLAGSIPLTDDMKNASFFITGATGYIGSMLVRTLLECNKSGRCNNKIIILVRSMEKAEEIFGEDISLLNIIISDIRNNLNIPFDIDYIFHCASVTSSNYMKEHPQETIDIAVKGTENVLRLARDKVSKGVVYLSSMEVYGVTNEEDNPVTEEKLGYIDLNNPRNCYPQSKRLCEILCRDASSEGVPIKIARLAQTFGPGVNLSDNRVFMQFAKAVIDQRDIVLHTTGKSMSNFCYITDAINGLFTILCGGKLGEAYNVCNDSETRTIVDIAKMVAANKVNIVFDIPQDNKYGYAVDTKLRLCSKKLITLGWKAEIDMKNGYKRFIKYLLECTLMPY